MSNGLRFTDGEFPRVIVCGSRDWTDASSVDGALAIASQFWDQKMIVVHGHCSTGADAMADRWAHRNGYRVERHAADWRKGKAEGPRRNERMLQAGADLVIGFCGPCRKPSCPERGVHASHGTSHMLAIARHAGLPTWRIRP